MLTPDQSARAAAALDAWFADDAVRAGHVPARQHDPDDLERMHAALEAPDADAALDAFPGPPIGFELAPEQARESRELMIEIRRVLSQD